ncbi:MAG: polymer-forming cytoskeletal protein [Acidobacteria bacterium]|nr:polymer-forming cytoskeletal protein [Acidobacteriota bacterium]
MHFLLFSLGFLFLFYLHFGLANWAWRTIRGRHSSELDMGYVRLEDYFGQSFRTKLREWLRVFPRESGATAALQVHDLGGERIFVAGSSTYPSGRREREVLVIEGDFRCGNDCEFERELMVKGDCQVGADTQLRALAVDGKLRLEEGAAVKRWVDATKELVLGPDCVIASRATSRTSIEIQPGARALSFLATEVFTEGRHEPRVRLDKTSRAVLQIPHAEGAVMEHGYDPAKLFSMGGGCYLYQGDLETTIPIHLKANLVVRGKFYCPKESLLDGNLKAAGRVTIGAASVVRGTIVAGQDLVLNSNVYFQGLLHAGGQMRLCHGVRGMRDGLPVAVYSAGALTVESNVVVYGKLASARHVIAVSTPMAWLETLR